MTPSKMEVIPDKEGTVTLCDFYLDASQKYLVNQPFRCSLCGNCRFTSCLSEPLPAAAWQSACALFKMDKILKLETCDLFIYNQKNQESEKIILIKLQTERISFLKQDFNPGPMRRPVSPVYRIVQCGNGGFLKRRDSYCHYSHYSINNLDYLLKKRSIL